MQDYEYNTGEEGSESCDSVRTDGSELTGWEPRAAKRPRLTPKMDSTRLLQTLTPTSRLTPGRSYQVGYIRGGGRGAIVSFRRRLQMTAKLLSLGAVYGCFICHVFYTFPFPTANRRDKHSHYSKRGSAAHLTTCPALASKRTSSKLNGTHFKEKEIGEIKIYLNLFEVVLVTYLG